MDFLAVIPSLTVGGPLAILAILFPAVFGGVLILFRQWLAYFTVVSTNFTLWMLHSWLRDDYFGAWWTTDNALWFVMFGISSIGVVWAWRRHLKAEKCPRITERIVLGVLSIVCIATLWFGQPQNSNRVDVRWDFVWAFCIGIWLASAIRVLPFIVDLLLRRERKPDTERIRFPTEGILLVAMTLAMTAFTATRPQLGSISTKGDIAADAKITATLDEKPMTNRLLDNPGGSSVWSTPVLDGDHIYLSVLYLAEYRGAVFCYNHKTGKKVWEFNNQFQMRPIFSSPCLANGRIYVGEGLHVDKGCHMYCLDAKDGKEIWRFRTGSHTESTPIVANGRVFFGAGDDGVYCLDARSGKKKWQFQYPKYKENGKEIDLQLHVDANLAVAGDRVYGAGGWDSELSFGDPALFCLNADNGKDVWLRRTPKWMQRFGEPEGEKSHVPAWGTPVVDGNQAFFSVGNGRIGQDSLLFEPVGAILGLDAETGKDLWPPFRVEKAVVRGPVIDRFRVFFGARDSKVYCIGRDDGKLRWRKSMDGPVDAPLALDQTKPGAHANTMIAVSEFGLVTCFDPPSGNVHWRFAELRQFSPSISSRPVIVSKRNANGLQRQIFLGAAFFNNAQGAWLRLTDVYNEK